MYQNRLWIGLCLLLYILNAILYVNAVPVFEASDEAEHFIYIHTILETNALPIIQSSEQMAQQENPVLRWNNQAHHAPLYYLTSALLISWTERADITDYLNPNELIFLRNTVEDNPNKWLHRYTEPTSDTHIAVYFLRAINMLIGIGTLLMVYLAAAQTNDNRYLPVFTMFLTASIPTFTVVNTSVTNDALVIFLYSAGIYWTLRVWRTQQFRWSDIAIIALILSGTTLTKLTGITLFGVVYLPLLVGARRGKWSYQQTIKVIIVTGLVTLIFAGWWYWRNFQLYGDLFALDATDSIWGRTTPLTLAILPDELLRIGKSFWMMIGYLHNPVFAPDTFYIYTTSITVIGLAGLVAYLRSSKNNLIWILLFTCFVVSAMLIYGTFSVDISYGRLLLPAIAAFAPLLVIGWIRIFKEFAFVLIVPLTLTNLLVPLVLVPMAYPTLQTVDRIPSDAVMVGWQAENLEIIAVDIPNTTVTSGDTLTINLYFRGNHASNPALIVTAVDTVRVQRFDHHEIYPGMADMRYLPDERIFMIPIEFDIPTPDEIRAPRVVNILIEWVDLVHNEALAFDSGLSLLEIQGATYIDERYRAPQYGNALNVNFGDEIVLTDFSIPQTASAGETIDLTFVWDALPNLREDMEAILTIQLFNSDNQLMTQEDGVLWWYPTTRWAQAAPFADRRTLTLPDNMATGEYTIRVGWYRVNGDTFPRLTVDNTQSIDNLFIIPTQLTVSN